MHIYIGQMYPTPIDHRCMEYHYTKEISHIAECTYAKAPLLQLNIYLWNTTTLNTFNIYQNAHILRADVPPIQLTTDIWNTATSKKFHI